MAYQIETVTAENDFGMFLTFWGNVTLLKKDGRSFSKYYIKSKETPNIPQGWAIQSYTFGQPKKVSLKKGETTSKVTDDLGNIYYEITL